MGHEASLEHHTKGRVRIRVPLAKGDPEALSEIQKALAAVAGVQSVKVNEAIGTVTVLYDPDRRAEILQHLSAADPQKKVTVSAAPSFGELRDIDGMAKETEFLADHSHVAKALFEFVGRVDQGVKRATGNFVDLKVIAPLALAAGVFFELGVAASTPVWLTLGLFSFNHFIDLHSHPQTRPEPESIQPEPKPVRRAQRFP